MTASSKPKKLEYELKKFDAASFSATETCWRRDLEKHKKEVMPSIHEGKLDWAKEHLDYAQDDGNTLAYGIFKEGEPHAYAIVDIVYTKSGAKWLKMLDLTLCPSLDLAFGPQGTDFSEIYGVFTAAIIGTIKLTKANHPTKVTKLYGRYGTLLAFLSGIGVSLAEHAKQHNLAVSVTVEGRWLVFRQR